MGVCRRGVQRVVATTARGRRLAHPWDVAFLPSSGLQSVAEDLARFGSEMLAVAAGTSRLAPLRGGTLREMTEVRLATAWSGVSQGYGWQLEGSGREIAWRHAGGEAGFESLLVLYPAEGFGIVALGNRNDWPRFQLVSALAAEVRAKRTTCGARQDSN